MGGEAQARQVKEAQASHFMEYASRSVDGTGTRIYIFAVSSCLPSLRVAEKRRAVVAWFICNVSLLCWGASVPDCFA